MPLRSQSLQPEPRAFPCIQIRYPNSPGTEAALLQTVYELSLVQWRSQHRVISSRSCNCARSEKGSRRRECISQYNLLHSVPPPVLLSPAAYRSIHHDIRAVRNDHALLRSSLSLITLVNSPHAVTPMDRHKSHNNLITTLFQMRNETCKFLFVLKNSF